jgi:hypothetical protein
MIFFTTIYISSFIYTCVHGYDRGECDLWAKSHIFNTSERNYMNFTFKVVKFASFNQLNVSCPQGMFTEYNINLFPLNEMLLFNIEQIRVLNLIKMFNLTSFRKFVLFHKIKGFDFYDRNLSLNHENLEDYSINFYDSMFDFYLNGTKLVACSANYTFFNYFGSIQTLVFNKNTLYNTKVCPYVFSNTNLKYLEFKEISNSLIYKNQLEFLPIDSNVSIAIRLVKIQFTLAFEHLTLKILDKNLFKKLQIITLNGILNSIETNLFVHFHEVNRVILNIENLKTFFHNIGLDWIDYLNLGSKFNLSHFKRLNRAATKYAVYIEINVYSSIFQPTPYAFPNEDICLFKKFPHDRLVYPLIQFLDENQNDLILAECSCTLKWLVQNAKYYSADGFSTEIQCFSDDLNQCDFEEMFNSCSSTNASYNFSSFGNLSMKYLFKWFEYVLEVYMKPMLCLLGILTNLIVIQIVKNPNRRKVFASSMYKHILANSIFNLMFCLLSTFSLVNVCIFPKSSFCSGVFQEATAQYIKIYAFNFVGNTIRFCCNFSNFAFALTRYLLSTSKGVGTNRTSWLKQIEKLNMKPLYAIVLAFGLLLSIFKVFEFKKNDAYNIFDVRFPFNAYDIDYCSDDSLSYSQSFLHKCNLFDTLNVINNVINNVLFWFFSVFIDFLLMTFARNYVRQKRDLNVNSEHEHEREHEPVREAIKLKEKINKLVFTNNILYLFSHFPEFITTILLLIYSKKMEPFCFDYFSCADLIEISQSFNYLSFSLQIFIFLDFDRNFRDSLDDLKARIYSWIKIKFKLNTN